MSQESVTRGRGAKGLALAKTDLDPPAARPLRSRLPVAPWLANGRTTQQLADRLLAAIQSIAPEWPTGRQSITNPGRAHMTVRLRTDVIARLRDNAAYRDTNRSVVMEKALEIGLTVLDAGFFPASSPEADSPVDQAEANDDA